MSECTFLRFIKERKIKKWGEFGIIGKILNRFLKTFCEQLGSATH
jgi:hypothetical protein